MEMVRPQSLAGNIVVIDGFSRSGKTLLGPVLSSLKRAELWCLDYLFEYLCTLRSLGKIDKDACAMMIRLYADIDLYHQAIGRNTNFRRDDDSGVYKNGLEKVYLKRTLEPAGDRTVRDIRRKRSILFLMTHYIFGASDILFESLKDRLKLYLLMERHPLWLIESWHEGGWDERIGKDPREFQLCCRVGGRVVPWFASRWAAEYASLGRLEQAIRVIAYFEDSFEKRRRRLLPRDRKKFLRVPFEAFATDPGPILRRIEKTLGTAPTPLTRQIMKKAGIPRAVSMESLRGQRKKVERLLEKEKVRPRYRRLLERLSDGYLSKHASFFKDRF
ncbi:MAG: hypothetical protein HYZ87_02565 [Candidatus Omnitrophica bacterium]|nr:hypothetical protein [Candidatus Omnitrophota bacterium]